MDWDALKAGPKAPRRADGTFLYVRVNSSWGRKSRDLVAATSLTDANQRWGYTREKYTATRLHRASVAEVEQFPTWQHPKENTDDQ